MFISHHVNRMSHIQDYTVFCLQCPARRKNQDQRFIPSILMLVSIGIVKKDLSLNSAMRYTKANSHSYRSVPVLPFHQAELLTITNTYNHIVGCCCLSQSDSWSKWNCHGQIRAWSDLWKPSTRFHQVSTFPNLEPVVREYTESSGHDGRATRTRRSTSKSRISYISRDVCVDFRSCAWTTFDLTSLPLLYIDWTKTWWRNGSVSCSNGLCCSIERICIENQKIRLYTCMGADLFRRRVCSRSKSFESTFRNASFRETMQSSGTCITCWALHQWRFFAVLMLNHSNQSFPLYESRCFDLKVLPMDARLWTPLSGMFLVLHGREACLVNCVSFLFTCLRRTRQDLSSL